MEERSGGSGLDGAVYETASFEETTSGDERTTILKVASDSSGDPNIQIFRQSTLSQMYDDAKNRAGEIEEYEK